MKLTPGQKADLERHARRVEQTLTDYCNGVVYEIGKILGKHSWPLTAACLQEWLDGPEWANGKIPEGAPVLQIFNLVCEKLNASMAEEANSN